MTNKPSRIVTRVGVLIALAALLLIVPNPAAAQNIPAGCDTVGGADLSASLDGGEDAITPIRDTETLTLNWNYNSPQGYSVSNLEIEFQVTQQPTWASVTLLQQNDFISFDAQEGAGVDDNGQVDVRVTVSQDAPAFARDAVEITATTSDGDCVEQAQTTAETEIQAGFYERWQARFEQSIHNYGQNTHFQIPLRIDNTGNGMIEVQLKHVRDDENRPERPLTVVTPGGFQQIGSEAQGASQNHQTIPIDVQTPFRNGYMNERLQLQIGIDGRSADDHEVALTPATLDATIQTQGVYVPGFPVVFALIAFLGVAMVQMKRRQ